MDPLRDFVDWIADLRRQGHEPQALLEQAQPVFLELLTPATIPAAVWERGDHQAVRHLLHRSETLTVFAIASPPGSASDIHDHGSWGLVGQVAGEEIERTYHAEPASDGLVRLLCTASHRLQPGAVATIQPPARDLHQVETVGAQPSITLHAFARDPVEGFTYYQPELYTALTYRGAYDNE